MITQTAYLEVPVSWACWVHCKEVKAVPGDGGGGGAGSPGRPEIEQLACINGDTGDVRPLSSKAPGGPKANCLIQQTLLE